MIEVPADKVIVEVNGGLVDVVWTPPGITAVVVDWDHLQDADCSIEDARAIVAASPELPWGSERYPYPQGLKEIDFVEVPDPAAAGPRSRPSAMAERAE